MMLLRRMDSIEGDIALTIQSVSRNGRINIQSAVRTII
jgi:hypothetical protein